jgi:hypothetical protein
MAMQRLSRLQKRIVGWLAADAQRMQGVILSSHEDLVRAVPGDKGNIRLCWLSHKLVGKQSDI